MIMLKYPAKFELYKNGEIIRTELEGSNWLSFTNVMVKTTATLKVKVLFQNGFGAFSETRNFREITIESDQDVDFEAGY